MLHLITKLLVVTALERIMPLEGDKVAVVALVFANRPVDIYGVWGCLGRPNTI